MIERDEQRLDIGIGERDGGHNQTQCVWRFDRDII